MPADRSTQAPLASLALSDVLALMPDGCEWTVNDGAALVRTASGSTGLLYWDDQDHENKGWAYRLQCAHGEETGSISDADDVETVFA